MERELKFKDSQDMIKRHHEDLEQEAAANYIRAQINARKELRIKKSNIKKKVVKTILIASCGAAITMAGNFAHTQHQGSKKLGKEMNEIIAEDNYAFVNYSDGYRVNQGTRIIETDDALNDIVEDARNRGMSYAEIVVGLNNYFGAISLENIIGEENIPSLSERISVKEKAYYESKLQEVNKGGSK